ncbi:efflux RND transporter permease subunit [Synechococcus elongatus]|uniref:efflux RND transporter permease subunit n=1 Tax=Synechococcus elongatus TaxID=32046 RepID=UPI000F7F2485|nr:efflux RND transporter permease subunit [Synechococcus elongatus]
MSPTPPPKLSLSGLSIRRHIGTLMLTLATVVVAVFLVSRLQVDLLPSITYPRIGVRLTAPGLAPEIAVEEVTKPLEESLSATEGVVQIFSRTREGDVSIDLFFEPGGNIDQALNDATATFNRARSRLPEGIEEARLFKFDPSQLPVYEFALSSTERSPQELRLLAEEELARELTLLPGVAAVDVTGGLEEEVRVLLDPDRLQALGIGLETVLNELQESNQDVSGGRLLGSAEPLTRTTGRFQDAQDILDLTFERAGSETDPSQQLRLRDFAQVIDGSAEQRIFVSLNGQPAVKVSVQKQPEANTIAVVDAVKQRLNQLQANQVLGQGVQVLPTLDESIFIQNAIGNVTSSGLAGAGLAALAVLLFLGSWRQTLIIVISIPLATLAAIVMMRLAGFSLNIFSLGGLALGVGIVVDNSIVMLETIADGVGITPGRDSRSLLSPRQVIERAIDSSQKVESALIASTTTNLVAVLPFLMLGGFISLLFSELILTISFAVAASILVALTVVPAMASRLLARKETSGLDRWPPLLAFQHQFARLQTAYGQVLQRLINRPLRTIAIAFLVLGLSGASLLGQLSQEILPRINTGQAQLFVQFPPGTPLVDNQRVMAAIEQLILEQPETDYAFSTIGGSLFGANTTTNVLRSSSTITLKPGSDVDQFVERLTPAFNQLNLVDTLVRVTPGSVRGLITNNSPLRGADIDVILQSEDREQLAIAGEQVMRALGQAQLARYRPDSDRREPELRIQLDRERAAALGLNPSRVGNTIQTAIEGSIPTRLQRGDRLVDVRVEVANTAINTPAQLLQLPLFSNTGSLIRLNDIARLETGAAPSEIQRINQRQVFQIAGNLSQGASLSAAIAEAERLIDSVDLPSGVSLLPSSAAESNRQLQASLPILGGLAGFLVYVVMAVQYNSLIDPLVIMFTLPLALAGGILGLYFTNTAIGATVVVGVVLLVGIVVNNAIILVELANQLREEQGCDRRSAILQAAPQRLRPVLMTTLTTVLGMLPLALGIGQGSEFLQPLGIVVFSGLSLATVLTLLVIPCFYVLLHGLAERWTQHPLTVTALPFVPGGLPRPSVGSTADKSSIDP